MIDVRQDGMSIRRRLVFIDPPGPECLKYLDSEFSLE
jgi:hypothetical protein